MEAMSDRNNQAGKLTVVFFTLVVLAGFQPGYTEELVSEQLRESAGHGDIIAQLKLAAYLSGLEAHRHHVEAIRWYRMAAEQGSVTAQVRLAEMHEDGKGVPKDDREAVIWYRKAAEQGNFAGQANLAHIYRNGEGVPEGDREAVKWYWKAAEQKPGLQSPRLLLWAKL